MLRTKPFPLFCQDQYIRTYLFEYGSIKHSTPTSHLVLYFETIHVLILNLGDTIYPELWRPFEQHCIYYVELIQICLA